jgi:hypothetical protein
LYEKSVLEWLPAFSSDKSYRNGRFLASGSILSVTISLGEGKHAAHQIGQSSLKTCVTYEAIKKDTLVLTICCPIQLPGRESRLNEPPFTSLPELLPLLGKVLLPYLDQAFTFFGHSMEDSSVLNLLAT